MSVRKTESRIPANFQGSDLGQAVTSDDGRCVFVSFITSPLAIDRENGYVIFVTDAALASAVQSFEWSFAENGGTPTVQTTEHGENFYRPQSSGALEIVVRLLGAGNAEQARVSLTQEVVPLNATLEALISGAMNEPGAGAGNPDVVRELVNDHNPYYQNVTLQTPEAGDGFKRFVFSMVHDGALQRTVEQRKQQIDRLSAVLNTPTASSPQGADFAIAAAEGAGVCNIRLALLAMVLPRSPGNSSGVLNWTELPEPVVQRAAAAEQLRQNLAALDEATKIDLFNLVRFPKSNITQCGRIIEALRNRYFSGANFNDVLTGMSGTRALWITRHFREGPLIRT